MIARAFACLALGLAPACSRGPDAPDAGKDSPSAPDPVAAEPAPSVAPAAPPGGMVTDVAELSRSDFKWDRYFWTATVKLPVWAGFQDRSGPYGGKGGGSQSSGSVRVVLGPEGRDDSPLQDNEVARVRWALEHAEEMQRSLLADLVKEYPKLQAEFAPFVDEGSMPPVRNGEDLRPLIGLHSLNVHVVEKDGLPYVGFEFGCTWDSEHGLGALMHGSRVVEIGGADTAILLWIAEEDAKKGPS